MSLGLALAMMFEMFAADEFEFFRLQNICYVN